jgi:8-oxo-dGTP diphosphatase
VSGRAVVAQAAVSAVIFDHDGRVLLVERGEPPGQGLWTVPGGKVEPGELLEAAVRREVREETGLVVAVGPLVTVVERFDLTAGYHYVILDYLATVQGGQLAAGSDARQVGFCDEAELDRRPLTAGLRPVIEEARRLAQALARAP